MYEVTAGDDGDADDAADEPASDAAFDGVTGVGGVTTDGLRRGGRG